MKSNNYKFFNNNNIKIEFSYLLIMESILKKYFYLFFLIFCVKILLQLYSIRLDLFKKNIFQIVFFSNYKYILKKYTNYLIYDSILFCLIFFSLLL
jgi:hypothetical protein